MRITSLNGFKGIDENRKLQGGLEIASKMSNFKITKAGSLKKRNDIVRIHREAGGIIEGIWSGSIKGVEKVVFVAEGRLYAIEPRVISPTPVFIGNVEPGEALMFGFSGMLYIKVRAYYYRYDGENLENVEGYVPLVALSCRADGSGEIFEQINLICDKRRQLFSADGVSTDYILAEKDINSIVSVKVDGQDITGFELGSTKDCIHFSTPPKEGLNNMEVVYSKTVDESDRNRIFGCSKVMLFGGNSDGRIFLWGNEKFPNYRFHSDLANGVPSAEYFPVNAFTVIGNNKINSIVQQYDRMLIFSENQAFYSYCELRDDGLGNTYSSFPVFSLNGSKGCLIESKGCIMDNRPITLCDDGLNMWESTSLPDEKNAVCFSTPIDISLKKALLGDLSTIKLFDFQANRELFFVCDDTAYIYNYGNGVWYTYDQFGGKHHCVCGTVLYFARDNIIYAYGNGFGESGSGICSWESAFTSCGQTKGKSDLIGLEADIYTQGSIALRFEIENKVGEVIKVRNFSFSDESKGFRRISFRIAVKRCMPFKLRIIQTGTGEFSLHGMIIKTREKERSERIGIR